MTDQVQLLIQAQAFQQQLQSLMFQKETLSMQMIEIKKAVEELDKTKDLSVYKITGPILIKFSKSNVKKELDEKEDLINLRIKTLEKNEMRVKDKLNELREDLSKKVGG